MSKLGHDFDSPNVKETTNHRTSLLSINSIPQITLTEDINDSNISNKTISLSTTEQPTISKLQKSNFTSKKQQSASIPPPISTGINVTSNFEPNPISFSPISPKLNDIQSETSPKKLPSPLPLTRDLLRRKNKLDNLQDTSIFTSAVDERITLGLGIITPKNQLRHRHKHSRSISISENKSINASDNSYLSINPPSIHSPGSSPPRSPISLQQPWTLSTASINSDRRLSVSNGTSTELSFYHHHPPPIPPTSDTNYYHHIVSDYDQQQQGKYITKMEKHIHNNHRIDHQHVDKKKHSYYQNHHKRNLQYSSSPSYKRIFLRWLYAASNRVVNTRAPESTPMASLSYRELLILFSLSENPVKQSQQEKIDQSIINIDNEKKESDQHISPHIQQSTIFAENDKQNNTIPFLQGNSLRIFSPYNSFRLFLWKYITRNRFYELFMLIILLIHWLLLATHPFYSNNDKSIFHGHWDEYIILSIQIIYSLDCIAKIIIYGFWISPQNKKSGYYLFLQPIISSVLKPWKRNTNVHYEEKDINTENTNNDDHHIPSNKVDVDIFHNAYLTTFGNWIEFISLLCYWIDFALMIHGYQYCSLFKAMGALRPVKLLSIFSGTAVILKSLETGWDLLLDVAGFLFFFMFLFALVGLVTFHGVFSRRCYFYPDGPDGEGIPVEPTAYCSGYYNGSTIVGPFDISTQSNDFPGLQGYICVNGQRCMSDPSNNPSYGYMNYDMIFSAFLNVYTFVSMELWTDMMYIAQDADSRLAALYYCVGVYLIGFIFIFLLFAVITSAFARVRAANQSGSAFISNNSKSNRKARMLRQQHLLELLHLHHGSQYQQPRQSIDSGNEGSEFTNDIGITLTNSLMDSNSRFNQWRSKMIKWVQSRTFFYIGGALVLINALFMCLRSVYASESMLEFLDNVETGFTFIFAIEIVIRIVGTQHWLQFWNSNLNKLDLIIVITTCVIQLPMIQDDPVYKYLTIFQVLRTYRLFLCVPRVEKLLNAAFGTGESFINVIAFMLLSTALFSTVFMQLFGGDFVDFVEPNEEKLRFDTFWQSFLSLIMLYTSETWTDTLFDVMKSQETNGGAIYAALATCLYFAFARYIIAGLYIAVILENFELDDEYIRHYQIKHFIREKMALKEHTNNTYIQNFLQYLNKNSNQKNNIQVKNLPTNLTTKLSKNAINILSYDDSINQQPLAIKYEKNNDIIDFNSNGSNSSFFDKQQGTDSDNQSNSIASKKKRTFIPEKVSKFFGEVLFPNTNDIYLSKQNEGISKGEFDDDYDTIVAEENKQANLEKQKLNGNEDVRSLFIFSEKNIIRRGCKRLVGSCKDGKAERKNIFNWLIMACVLISILVVILDEPSTRKLRSTDHNIDLVAFNDDVVIDGWTTYDLIDIALGCVFVLEMIIRIIADGFIFPQNSYLRHAWNRLDFVVTVLNFGTLFSNNQDLPRALGTVRSMRILRLIRYFGGVRDVFIDLFHAFPLMLDAMLLTFLVMIPFSVYGVNIFGGRFWTCNDDSVGGRLECMNEFVLDVGNDEELPLLVPRSWSNPYMNLYSFDDFPIALRHLFSLTSTEGWVNSMFYAMSTPTENDIQPVFNWNSPTVYHSIYYVIFMIISHGTVQLFVGVIIEKFKQRSGISTLTFAQRQYADLQRQLAELKPTMKVFRPTTSIRSWCYDLVSDRYSLFNRILMGVVILNILVLATEFNDEPYWVELGQDYAYFAFATIYFAEVIIKILGLGLKKWLQRKWNIYDACIAVSSFVLVIIRFISPYPWSSRAERYCLIFAAFRLGEGIDALQTLYQTIAMATPSIIRVSAVFMLVMCLFAMIFMEFFGLTKYGQHGTNNSNFRTYGNALLLLVRMTTGEAWNEVMMDYTFAYPNCVASSNYLNDDCGSANWAYFLFNFFYITCTHIFLNLFTAVIISNFEYAYETRSRFTLITKNDLRWFKQAWAEVDPNATGYIKKEDVAKLFKLLQGRFQINIYDKQYSFDSLYRLGFQRSSTTKNSYTDFSFNYKLVNQSLSSMDPSQIEKRRKQYNLLYMEVVDAATSKGISFSDMIRIMALRFVDIEKALTLHPLLERLEKVDQFNQAYAKEKASGVFLTLIQRKRYLKKLWMKRDEEAQIISLNNDYQISPRFGSGIKNHSTVPTIMVENVIQTDYASPTLSNSALHSSRQSIENNAHQQQDNKRVVDNNSNNKGLYNDNSPVPRSPSTPSSTGAVGSGNISPNPDFDDGFALYGSYQQQQQQQQQQQNSHRRNSSLAINQQSPLLPPITITHSDSGSSAPPSPSPILSPYQQSQSWLFIDANSSISSDQAQLVMDSLVNSSWRSMLDEMDD
ncbi:unnamed protein product [Cunninghamella blakesleeana]